MAEQSLQDRVTLRPANRTWMRWAGGAGVVGLAVSLLGGITWLLQTPTLQVANLPSGGPLHFVGVTYGTEHLYLDGPRWQQLLLPLVGVRRAQAWGWHAGALSSPKPTPVVWITCANLRALQRAHPLFVQISNENGTVILPDPSRDFLFVSDTVPYPFPIHRYPRRGKWIYLELRRTPAGYDDSSTPVARLKIPNPTSGPLPQWTPQPLPQAVQSGNQTFLLRSFQVGRRKLGEPRAGGNRTISFAVTSLEFQVREKGRSGQVWQPLNASFANAAGDSWRDRATRGEKPNDLSMVGSVGTEEAAWKISVQFGRTSGFTPAESWRFRDAPTLSGGRAALTRGRIRMQLRYAASQPLPGGARRVLYILDLSSRAAGNLTTITSARDERGRNLLNTPHRLNASLTFLQGNERAC